ncbi:MAG TPA: DUF222 domain-containing protein [Actinopolymorphaceae bacterium]|jgi:hypothetical protein
MTETRVPPAAGIDHPVARAVVEAIAGLSGVASPGEPGMWQLSDADCLAVKMSVHQLTAVLGAVDLQLLGEIDLREATTAQAGINTIAWLHGHCQQSLSAARADVALARGLRARFAGVTAGMSAGAVSKEQAHAIVSVLTELPDDLAADEVARAEEAMVDFAADHAPVGLRKLAGHLLAVVAPEVAEAHEADVLEKQEREAARTQFLRWRDDGDGALRFSGKLPAGQGEQLRAVVEAIAKGQKPSPDTRTPATESVSPETGTADEPDLNDESWAGFGTAGTWSTPQAAAGMTDHCMSIEARRAQALMSLVHVYLANGAGPRNGGDRPRVTVLVNYDDLIRGVAGATLLGSNTRISPSEARRLACDADILPAVMGSASQLLDLGRTTRLFAGDLRQAIVLRDRGCVFPDCHREPRDCDAHHIKPWEDGGPTSFENGALVCPTHHRLVEPDPHADRATEHERWHMRMSHDGIPEVIPPSINDEYRQPQRHKRFLLRR